MIRRKKRRWLAAVAFSCTVLSFLPAAAMPKAEGPPLRVTPSPVQVGLFYDGAVVTVEGTVPSAARVAVICTGAEGSAHLKRKGKVWGLFWMSTGEVEIRNVPALYLCALSGKADEAVGVGYGALRSRAEIEPPGEEEGVFHEFIRLKEEEGLYARLEEAVRMDPASGGGAVRIQADLPLSPKAPPGTYTIRVLALEPGGARVVAEAPLEVKKVGTAAWITQMARDKGLLYGVLAVIVALFAGLVTGVLFSLGGKGAH